MKFPKGVSDFKKLVDDDYTFVDKSLFIKDIINDGADVILITRPRRFGKTLNLSMLYYFLSLNHHHGEHKNLFEGLEISKDVEFCKQHQHQYPAIFISFKDIKKPDYAAAYASIVLLIKDLYAEHRYLLEGDLLAQDEKNTFMALLNKQADKSDVEAAIKKLSEYITKKFNQPPIILIDEYDTPIQESHLKKYYEEMIGLIRSILGQALKDNKYLSKAILTGITRISQESLFSGLNNVEVYSLFREKYGQYFGFLEDEVLELIKESQTQATSSSIKEWYNGYQIGRYVLYNPWSIISCLKNDGELSPYWVNTASNALIAELLTPASTEVKRQFEDLLQGKVIEQPIFENLVFTDIKKRDEALWSLLLYAGYLKVLSSEISGFSFKAHLAIPNKEVRFVYDQIVTGWFSERKSSIFYEKFIKSLTSGDIIEFKNYLSHYLMQTGSYFEFNQNTPEQIFHVFILGLVVGLRDNYIIYSNQESGFGRFDVILLPKNTKDRGILLEFKKCEKPADLLGKAQEALNQIKDKHYKAIFMKHDVKSILAIGLSFCEKQVEMAHEII